MSKIYTSAVPLTMVRTVEGSYSNVLQDEQIPGEIVQPDDLKRLVRKGFLVEVKEPKAKGASAPADEEPKPGTAAFVLKEVGDDKVKAQAALDEEKAGQNRKGLVADLEKVLAG